MDTKLTMETETKLNKKQSQNVSLKCSSSILYTGWPSDFMPFKSLKTDRFSYDHLPLNYETTPAPSHCVSVVGAGSDHAHLKEWLRFH